MPAREKAGCLPSIWDHIGPLWATSRPTRIRSLWPLGFGSWDHDRGDPKTNMVFRYEGGVAVPSWLVSDGTLRLATLTLPAYLTNIRGVYLIEEPENGIHPGAISTVYDSLSSVYGAQVLLATHSTVILNAARPCDVLCFAKDEAGSTDIVLGTEHPRLRKWHRKASLGTLLTSDDLGVKELVVLAADKDLQFALEGLLARSEALGIRPIEKDIFVEPEHDPGCGAHRRMWPRLPVGEAGIEGFVAGWFNNDGWQETRSSPLGPRKRFRRHCAKPDNRGARPCIDSLPSVFLCRIVRTRRSVNSGTC